jgi:hypothetical protein
MGALTRRCSREAEPDTVSQPSRKVNMKIRYLVAAFAVGQVCGILSAALAFAALFKLMSR